MTEAGKSKKNWTNLERSVLRGRGIDIGCGNDPVAPNVRKFDVDDGDANEITKFVSEKFDFVFSSHCLEHMHNPKQAINEWWQLVKPNGYLFFIVPDEDLYEQGVFPSRFNRDHKATFTISKSKSWSPVSVNVLELALSLPGSELVSIALQDQGYDRRMYRHGPHHWHSRLLHRLYFRLEKYNLKFGSRNRLLVRMLQKTQKALVRYVPDQTLRSNASAQIQCIVRKKGEKEGRDGVTEG
jgi:SAM-dependent methyltransferase